MSSLKEISQLAWEQCFPNPGDETKITREQFFASAKSKYAYFIWRKIKEDKAEYTETDIPSYLLTETEITVSDDNTASLKDIKMMQSIDLELWLQDVRGLENNCSCKYVKTTLNKWKALCDDDSLDDNAKLVYPLGKKLYFPLGVHSKKLLLIYAKNGENLEDDEVEVDEAIGAMVLDALLTQYLGKIGVEDKKNDTNSNP